MSRRVVYRLEVDVSGFAAAMRRMTEQIAELGQTFARLRERHSQLARALAPHAFTPTLDLVCRVCGVGPEECKGGRP